MDTAAIMDVFLSILYKVMTVLYYQLAAIFLFFVPRSLRKHKNVAGQTVLITGAASGIGKELALKFANLKCSLVLWDINKNGLEEAVKEIEQLGVWVKGYQVDVSSREKIYKAAEELKNEHRDVDILINNAGIVNGKSFLETPDKDIENLMNINVFAHFWTIKAFLPQMLKKQRGHIVTIASVAGHIGCSGIADYCASKFANVGFEASLRMELYKTNINTTCVCPYYINTGMFDGIKILFPVLTVSRVVNDIMHAVLTNQHELVMPKYAYFILALQRIVPVRCALILADITGLNKAMNTFIGRKKDK